MARISRLVVSGYPHHVTQRGVRSIPIFDDDGDRIAYLEFHGRGIEAVLSRGFGLVFDDIIPISSWCCKVMVTEIPDDPHPRAVAMARWVLLAMGMLFFVLAAQFCLAG